MIRLHFFFLWILGFLLCIFTFILPFLLACLIALVLVLVLVQLEGGIACDCL